MSPAPQANGVAEEAHQHAESKPRSEEALRGRKGVFGDNKVAPALSLEEDLDERTISEDVPARPNSAAAEVMLTAEELIEMGFKRHSASSMDPASKLPITFMVLDIIRSNLRQQQQQPEEEVEPGGNSTGTSRKYRNRLVPIYLNEQCRGYFKIAAIRDYVEVLKKLLKRDPLLTFALQKAVRHLKAGDAKSISHVTPDPSGHTSSLIGMRVAPCVWSGRNGRLYPALMFEHNVAYNPAVVMPRLMRDYAVLSHVPAILTLIDFQVSCSRKGRLFQVSTSLLALLPRRICLFLSNVHFPHGSCLSLSSLCRARCCTRTLRV